MIRDKEPYLKEPLREEDINLTTIIKWVSQLSESISRKLAHIGSVIKSYFKLILLFVVIGTGIGYFAYTVTKPYYKSSMTLVLADIRNEFVEDQLIKLAITVKEDNFTAVSDMLGVSEDDAKQIKQMNFSNLDADRIAEDSVLTGSPFRIELSLYDTKLFPAMEDALANYLENNRYFTKLKSIREKEIKGVIAKLNNEIESIDSIKTTVNSPRGPVNGFVYGQPVDPTNLYRESISMYQHKAALESELEQLDNIQIVNGFAPRLKPAGPKLLIFLSIGALAAFIIGVIIAYNREAKKRREFKF